MGKYALILAFTYPKIHNANYELQSLPSALVDIGMVHKLCLKMGILPHDITIVTDIPAMKRLPSELNECNLHRNPFPSDTFVCREICQFIENTVRGIKDVSYKSGDKYPEIFLYISGHGDKLKIDGIEHQGIILTNDDGTNLKYLLSKDIFNIIFGNFYIDNTAIIEIPTYTKLRILKKYEEEGRQFMKAENLGIEEKVTVKLTPTIPSPANTPELAIKNYRSSYLTHRGIPVLSKMLIVIDTCYSEHMTYFPYSYDPRSQLMIPTSNINIDVGTDLPYCVTISSCEANKTTTQKDSGSSLTKILYMNLIGIKTKLTISQLHYLIYNTKNNIIKELLSSESAHPIITSTCISSEMEIPFFNTNIEKITKIIEK